MLLAENFLIVLKGAAAMASTHEVEVAETRGETTANSGPGLLTMLAALKRVQAFQAKIRAIGWL